ncbi:ATP-binding protein [Lutimonas halocynthiae]|uniref:sensor histidine kinase n=1 Tax=Lutimonas halocynthiae TaxID=1446477 RepID=UPI0025B549E8|nr:ATP-binding protein [Lutimonas halocynthiae]MDN3642878.1 ATP-binding protein [Lutimonas halocynthiae]
MVLEPFVLVFIIWHIRKNLRLFSPNTHWDKSLLWAMVGIVILFILERAIPITVVINWIWHLSILGIGYLVFRLPLLERMRTIIIAVLPLIAIITIGDLVKIIYLPLYEKIDDFLSFAIVFSIAWMIAMLIRSNKQNKALNKERQKTLAEEERNKFISAQKEKLELIVEERTAEITKQKDELMDAFTELKNTQSQLVQSEKMASLGELTAGIAHEIQNPLNFVNNFSEVSTELLDEMMDELKSGNTEEVLALASDVKANQEKINHHGKRAGAIVKGMLLHSRTSSGKNEPTDINALCDEYLRLSYHGLRAKNKSFNADFTADLDKKLPEIKVVPQDFGRVLLNLINNAFFAVNEKSKTENKDFKPSVIVKTKLEKTKVIISVSDNGSGIPEDVKEKIFQPFFTTKPTGEGTGLGLSLSYDIVTAHGGELKVKTNEGEGTEFIIILPV